MANPVPLAFPDGDNKPIADTRRYTAEAFALIKTDAAEVPNEDYSLTPYQAIIFGTDIFEYDSDDLTTAHDGLTVLVSLDGRRYKIQTRVYIKYKVDDKDIAAQPGSPSVGDAYLLPVAPTGDDWALKAKNIATYTDRGWVFNAPVQGDICFVIDEGAYYHYPSSAIWTQGLGNLALGVGAVKPRHLQKAAGLVVEAEQNSPPGSVPADGVAYIVGTVPTGAWVGKVGNIAISNGATWDYLAAYEGGAVYDKAEAFVKTYEGGLWVASQSVVADLRYVDVVADDTPNLDASVWYDALTLAVTSKVSNMLKFEIINFNSSVNSPSGVTVSARLIRDAEVIAITEAEGVIDWPVNIADERYYITPADSATHYYKFQVSSDKPNRIHTIDLNVLFTEYRVAAFITELD